MNKLKATFISAYLFLLLIVSVHIAYVLLNVDKGSLIWIGAALSVWANFMFFVRMFLRPQPRTEATPVGIVGLNLLGSGVASVGLFSGPHYLGFLAFQYAVLVGLGGFMLYNFWYSRFPDRDKSHFQVGATLEDFELEDINGQPVKISSFYAAPAVIIFYRGNWCPLCMAQIKEIAASYRALEERGVKVILVSPQPEEFTRKLASKFDVSLNFLVDRDNKVAKQLGIVDKNGLPAGLGILGYESDTVMPTVIIIGEKGKMLYTDLTDNYRVRPEPDEFLKVIDEFKPENGRQNGHHRNLKNQRQ